jgi:hypothetical protein
MNPVEKRPKKVLLISSSGGHWTEMRRLDPAFADCEKYYACTNADYQQFVGDAPFYAVPDASMWSKARLVWQAAYVLGLLVYLRPAIVASTGASVGFFALLFAKKMGIKTIWVDSLANAERLSLSGEKVRPYADLWLTQWEHLATAQGPYFHGAIL